MARRSGSFRRLVPYDAVVSRDGRSFPRHVATVILTGIDKTPPQDFQRPGLPLPYKRAGRALQRAADKPETTNNRPHTSPKPSAKHFKAPHTEINISSNHLCTFLFL
jgi:hypothetical protein